MSALVFRILSAIVAVIMIFISPLQPIVPQPPVPKAEDCADGTCPWNKRIEPQSSVVVFGDDKYAWVQRSAEQYTLEKNGVTIGQWYVPNNAYYPWQNGQILSAAKPPIDPPQKSVALTKEQKEWCKNGVEKSNLFGSERLNFSGKIIHPSRLYEAFNGQLQDDSDKGYLVIISKDPTKRDQVFKDWKSLPTDFTDRFLVWQAPPDHFSMQDRFLNQGRFYTEGDPTVVLQSHDGTVLFRRPQAGQSYKTSDMQDLLKSDPSYNPKLDPGAPAAPSHSFSLSTQTTTALVVGGVGVVALLYRRKK